MSRQRFKPFPKSHFSGGIILKKYNSHGYTDLIVPLISIIVILVMVASILAITQDHVEDSRGQVNTTELGASYIIYQDGMFTCAKNGQTSRIDFKSSDASAVIQSALDNAKGGRVYLKPGIYSLVEPLIMEDVTLTGTHQAILLKQFVGDMVVSLRENSVLDGITIDGNNATLGTGADNGVSLSSYSTIQNCVVQNVRAYSINAYKGHDIKIVNNIVRNGYQYGIVSSGQGEVYNSNVVISGNTIENFRECGMKIRKTESSVIDGNTILLPLNGNAHGIRLYHSDGPTRNIVISNNAIIDKASTINSNCGISVGQDPAAYAGQSRGTVIIGNSIYGCHTAIKVDQVSALVTGNVILESRIVGVHFDTVSGGSIHDNLLRSSNIYLNACDNISVQGNNIRIEQYAAAGVFGVRLLNCDSSIVQNNKIYDGTCGISLEGVNTGVRVLFNDLANTTTPIKIKASDFKKGEIKGNSGFVTEARGTAIIGNGNTTVTVTHGLITNPNVIIVTGSTADTNACFVTNVGKTSFRINVESAVGGDRTVYWYAECKY